MLITNLSVNPVDIIHWIILLYPTFCISMHRDVKQHVLINNVPKKIAVKFAFRREKFNFQFHGFLMKILGSRSERNRCESIFILFFFNQFLFFKLISHINSSLLLFCLLFCILHCWLQSSVVNRLCKQDALLQNVHFFLFFIFFFFILFFLN